MRGWECYNLSTTENTAQHPVSELYQLMGELSANSAAVKIRREEKDWGAAVREKIRHLITGRKLEGTGASVGAARKVACQKNPRVAQTKKKTPKTSKTPKRTAQPKKPHEIVVLPDGTPFLSILSKEGTLQKLPAQFIPVTRRKTTRLGGGGGVESDARHTEYDYFAERMFPRLKIFASSKALYDAIGAPIQGEVVQSSKNGNYYVLGNVGQTLKHNGKEVTNAQQILHPNRLIEIASEVPWFNYSGIPVDEYRRGAARDKSHGTGNTGGGTTRYHHAATHEDDGSGAPPVFQNNGTGSTITLKWITGIYPIYRGLMTEGYNQRLKQRVDQFMARRGQPEYSLGQLYHYLRDHSDPLVLRPLQRTILIIDEMQIMFRQTRSSSPARSWPTSPGSPSAWSLSSPRHPRRRWMSLQAQRRPQHPQRRPYQQLARHKRG